VAHRIQDIRLWFLAIGVMHALTACARRNPEMGAARTWIKPSKPRLGCFASRQGGLLFLPRQRVTDCMRARG